MAQLSPGVEIIERDFTVRIPTVTSSVGAMVIATEKGPINKPILINTEKQFIETFGEPDDVNYKHWFTASAFLKASDQLWVVRTEDKTKLCAGVTIGTSGALTACGTPLISSYPTPKAAEFFPLTYDNVSDTEAVNGNVPVFNTGGGSELFHIYAVGAGPYYEGVQVVVINSVDYKSLLELKEEYAQAVTTQQKQAIIKKYYTGTPATSADAVWDGSTAPTSSDPYYVDGGDYLSCSLVKDDVITSEVIDGKQVWYLDTSLLDEYTSFEFGPQATLDTNSNTYVNSDEFAVFVYDPKGNLAEQYLVSNTPDKVDDFGNKMFAPDVINGNSAYIYFFVGDDPVGASGIEPVSTGKINLAGADALTTSLGDLTGEIEGQYREWFTNKETLDIDVFLDADYPTVLKQALDDIAKNIRKDCFVILNVPEDKMVNLTTHRPVAQYVTTMKNYVANDLKINSSYSAIYGQYFKIFDRFNEVERWVPVTGYVGATIARVDFNTAQWFAPAGLNRGIIDGITDVALTPDKPQRDVMYVNRINPIVNFTGQGIVIWGQKTLQARPSAFDRINVRRLFLHMERSIEKLARYFLFEINDEITRSRFRGLVNGFLSDIKVRRGVTDFLVVCDSSNNPPDVVDRNEFVAEILVKPTRAIEFIKLVFTAVNTGVSFSEVVGGA
jgi:phage tail sheath protein FI